MSVGKYLAQNGRIQSLVHEDKHTGQARYIMWLKANVTPKQNTQCNIRTTKLITEPEFGIGHYGSLANSSRLSVLSDKQFHTQKLID